MMTSYHNNSENNIVQTGEPPYSYDKVSKLMSIVLTQNAKKLFTEFLRIIRELNVKELPEEMETEVESLSFN